MTVSRYGPGPMDQYVGTRSADGRWWWDGARWQVVPEPPRRSVSVWWKVTAIGFLGVGGLLMFMGVVAFLGGVDLGQGAVQLFADLMVSVVGAIFALSGLLMLRGAAKR